MKQITTKLNPEFGKLLDIDVLDNGDWAGIFQTTEGIYIRVQDSVFESPIEKTHLYIRFSSNEALVLAEPLGLNGEDNIWVYTRSGKLVSKFHGGCCIEDVIARHNTIVVTYFDEGIFGYAPLPQEGICVFDCNGKIQLRYHTELSGPDEKPVFISDCDAACWDSNYNLWFFAYTEYELVKLELKTKQQTIIPVPEQLHGAHAITVNNDSYLFYSPFHNENVVFGWAPGVTPYPLGKIESPARGLPGGRFLTFKDHEYTIVYPQH